MCLMKRGEVVVAMLPGVDGRTSDLDGGGGDDCSGNRRRRHRQRRGRKHHVIFDQWARSPIEALSCL